MSDPATNSGSTKSDYTFGQLAIRENICTFEQVKEALDIQAKLRGLGIEPKKLGDILVEKGFLSTDQAAHLMRLQGVAAAGAAKLQIPGYEILGRIGQGAMGSVYKARQVSMDRIVAVKVLSGRYSKDRSFVERFLREARAVAKLNHENVISGIDVGELNGLHYFVMEFVDGAPVSTLMRKEGSLPEKRCLEIGQHVTRALAHAHKHGIVHRDVKPENIMITTGGVAKLCDLGLAKQAKGDSGATMDGQSVGTPNYISPEQARGEENIDIRSDIYSLGCSLYHMATGTTPFDGPNPMVVMTKHVTEWADPVKKRNPALSDGFSALITRMMQKRREDRPQDPDALLADLETLLRGGPLPAAATPTRVPPPGTARAEIRRSASSASRPPAKSSPVPLLIGIGAVVLVLLIAMKFVTGGSGEATPPPRPGGGTGASNPKPPPSDPLPEQPGEAVKAQVESFRQIAYPELERDARADRYTFPYTTLVKKIEQAKAAADTVALQAWQEELGRFLKAADAAVLKASGWEEIRRKAKGHSDAGRFAQAAEELAKLKDVYRWYSESPAVPTAVGKEHAEAGAKIRDDLRTSFVSTMQQAEAQFRSPPARNDAYGTLDTLLVSGDPERKGDVEAARRRFFETEIREIVGTPATSEKVAKAGARIEELKKLHAGQAGPLALLDQLGQGLSTAVKSAATAASAKAAEALTAFRPRFDAALKARDLGAARAALGELCLPKEPAVATALLPAPGAEGAVLKAFLDPVRPGPAEARKVVAMAEEGVAFTRKYPNDVAKEVYLALRTSALLEDLLEMALEGAKVQARDAGKFRTGFSSALQTAVVAEPPKTRKPGEFALEVAVGPAGPRVPVLLSPRGAPSLTLSEDDIVALARRAPAAASDPQFPLKAFLLYNAAEQLRSAKAWYEKLTTPELKLGLEGLAARFAGVVSGAAEAEAETMFGDAWILLNKKKDAAGGKKKFLECVEKYGATDFMSKPLPNLGKSRIDIVQAQFGIEGAKPQGARKSVRDLFGTQDVKELGRNRYEVVYQFKDEPEIAAFFAGDGNPVPARDAQGFSLGGNGIWYWKPLLKGNASIEVSFRAAAEGPFGLVVCGDRNQAGYAAVCDLPLGPTPVDALLKFPITQGLTAFVATAPANLSLQRGPNQASMTREGTRIRFTLNRVNVDGDNAQFMNGHVGIAPGGQSLLVDRVRIVGEVDAAWLDAELKKLGGN